MESEFFCVWQVAMQTRISAWMINQVTGAELLPVLIHAVTGGDGSPSGFFAQCANAAIGANLPVIHMST